MNVCIGLQCERVGVFNDIIAYNYTADNLNSISHSKMMSECEWIYLFERIREQLKKSILVLKIVHLNTMIMFTM